MCKQQGSNLLRNFYTLPPEIRNIGVSLSNRRVFLQVGDSELASKLARVRLQHLGGQATPPHLALTSGSPSYQSMAVVNPFMQAADCNAGMATWSSPCEDPTATATKSVKMADAYETGQTGLAQLAGLSDRGNING